jgi:hypothetical protein
MGTLLGTILAVPYPPPLREERHPTHWSELVTALQQGALVIVAATAVCVLLVGLSTTPQFADRRFDLRFASVAVMCATLVAFCIYYVSL